MEEKLREAFKKFVDDRIEYQTVAGTVLSVDISNATCDVQSTIEDGEYLGVRLRASIDGNMTGIIPVPKIGSSVLISLITNSDSTPFVSSCSDLDGYYIICDDIRLNGNNFGGLAIVQGILSAINRLENKFNSHTNGGNPLDGAFIIQPLTAQSDIENTKVKHGG